MINLESKNPAPSGVRGGVIEAIKKKPKAVVLAGAPPLESKSARRQITPDANSLSSYYWEDGNDLTRLSHSKRGIGRQAVPLRYKVERFRLLALSLPGRPSRASVNGSMVTECIDKGWKPPPKR
ncbi:MAG: hypothetical protein R8J41_00370 [Alphaproteobacteria bacterium]|nr:hypothetical protein [Alphaproteobacteria bacterium]